MMKKYIFLFIFLFSLLSVNAQITAIEPLNSYNTDNGVYIKDLGNQLPFWVGTWKGEVNNLKYTFQFVLFTQHMKTFPDSSYNYKDQLMVKFKVEDLYGNIIYNDLNSSTFNDYKIRFLINRGSQYFFLFLDDVSNCYNRATFSFVKDELDNLNIVYKPFNYGSYDNFEDCPYSNQADIPMFLPTSEFILTKQ